MVVERVGTTLLRDSQRGLGFSIAGGKGSDRYEDDSESVYISKIAEEGPAVQDGKLKLGDKIVEVRS